MESRATLSWGRLLEKENRGLPESQRPLDAALLMLTREQAFFRMDLLKVQGLERWLTVKSMCSSWERTWWLPMVYSSSFRASHDF